jgi:hypothetical protein
MNIEIIKVSNAKQLRQFIDFSYSHYKEIPMYVPELFATQKWMLSDKNPFFKHSQAEYFLAYLDGKLSGRIAAIYNTVHLSVYNDGCGFFGFFETVNNKEVAEALFNKAKDWLQEKGAKRMIGPTNLTTNDSCGILVDGFDKPPAVSMPFNMTYYDEILKSCGFKKVMDLYSYLIDGNSIMKSYAEVLDRIKIRAEKNEIIIRPIKFKNFETEIIKLRLVYNKTNESNWGFMPLNHQEFREMALQLKMITSEKLVLIAEKAGEIIGYLVAVPDLNQVLKNIKKGRLFPFGIIKLLLQKRKINQARVIILGVMPKNSNMGIDLMMYQRITEAAHAEGMPDAEASYVIESNTKMNSIIQKIGGEKIKTYRIYEIPINSNQL